MTKYNYLKSLLLMVLIVLIAASTDGASTVKGIPWEKSPFGFMGPISGGPVTYWEDYSEYLADLGVHWVRCGGIQGLRWGDVEQVEGGGYVWDKYDRMIRSLQAKGVNILLNIHPEAKWDRPGQGGVKQGGTYKHPPRRFGRGQRPGYRRPRRLDDSPTGGGRGGLGERKLPRNLEAYKSFVEATVERYDGDGINDLDDLRFPIKYWMVGTEPNHPRFWHDSPENYAILVKETCEAIKRADSSAKIAMAGSAGQIGDYLYANEKLPESFRDRDFFEERRNPGEDGFFIKVFRKLRELGPEVKGWIDIVDFHFYFNSGEYYKVDIHIHYLKRLLQDFGMGEKQIFLTEGGTFSGDVDSLVGQVGVKRVNRNSTRRQQSERLQAQELLKLYVYSVASGVRKIFWLGPVYSGGSAFFSNVGLISRSGRPRLGYYTYKKMVQVLGECNWNDIERVRTGTEKIRCFKFLRNIDNSPVYVLWWDYYGDKDHLKEVSLSIKARKVKITKSIIKEGAYPDPQQLESSFETIVKETKNSTLIVSLGQDPLYLEPLH